jgi:hypothetical protein
MTEESSPTPLSDADLIGRLTAAREVTCPECGQPIPPQAGGLCHACGATLHLRIWTAAASVDAPGDADRAVMMELLARRGGRCSACRYDLLGLRSTTCPECGGTLVLVLWSSGVSITMWLTKLLVVGSAAAVVCMWTLLQSLSLLSVKGPLELLGCFGLLVVNGGFVGGTIRTILGRRDFCRRPMGEQVASTLLTVILTIVGAVAAAAAFRIS